MTDPDFVAFDAPLRDGRTVRIRAIERSDESEVLQAFDRTSADARYMRFMRVVREPNRERLRKALARCSTVRSPTTRADLRPPPAVPGSARSPRAR